MKRARNDENPQAHWLLNNVYNISDNAQPILLQNPPFHTPLPLSFLYRHSMRSVYLYFCSGRGECRLPNANWPQLCLSCDYFYRRSIWFISYIGAWEHIMLKEEVGSYESKHPCPGWSFWQGSCRGGETNHCKNEVGSSQRDIEI